MKLNNHGWGLREMLLYCGLLLLFLAISVFFIIQASRSLEDISNDKDDVKDIESQMSYLKIEENIRDATYLYINTYYKDKINIGTLKVSTDNLVKYNVLDLNDLKPDSESKNCKGYSLVRNDDAIIVSSYIKCSNYETNGYQAWRLGE